MSVALERPVALRTDEAETRFFATRKTSLEIAAPLTAEDMVVQAMDDASPTKWHLAHTSWFFETFVLRPFVDGYRIFDETFAYCFNSYYETAGPRHARPRRGLLTRPTVEEVFAYRDHVDTSLRELFASGDHARPDVAATLELGRQHEQQHQELMLTDILALFACSPLAPAYRRPKRAAPHGRSSRLDWVNFDGGVTEIGARPGVFHFDNEAPRHKALLHSYRLACRLVTNEDWLAFIEDGGYRKPILWLADGWACVQREGWEAPGYWRRTGDVWSQMTLEGLLEIDPAAPVSHVSYYEADAFARWAGKRLPTEFEWEAAGADLPVAGNMLPADRLRPVPAGAGDGLLQMFGDVWEWTQSAYTPYPRYRPPEGAIGEYNGKFMVSQQVLKGASCATPEGHARASYRNFFYPHQRWQFTGLRLADDLA